jgi:hypothetical protein
MKPTPIENGSQAPTEPPILATEVFAPGPYGPPRRSSSPGTVLLLVFGGLGVTFLLCCGVCGGMGFWAKQDDYRDTSKTILTVYADHAVVIEQLGGIESCEGNMFDGWDDSFHDMVFDVRGPRGSGKIHVNEFLGELTTVVLRKDGKEWDLLEDSSSLDTAEKK